MLYFFLLSSSRRGLAGRLSSRVPDFQESMTVVSDGKPNGRGRGAAKGGRAASLAVAWKRSRRGLSEMARA